MWIFTAENSSSLYYLKIYLPKQRNVSPNTIRSYRKALEELLDYVKDCKQISLGEVIFDHLAES